MLQFNKIILHNFGSYSHSEVNLSGKGFCLVSGKNNYKKDNALSNGSGKSFLWSGICFALTGETIGGLKSNLKNINIDENVCYVSLDFNVDKDHYFITRHIAPKSDLKIIKNDVDVSGKGIRESEKKLGEFLPDLTKDLIASTIIIGQGMPNKFSSFSPSGRKELLEKLTKSDFMIEDIKNRVAVRQTELQSKIREFEDSLIANETQLRMAQSSLKRLTDERDEAVTPDFDELIKKSDLYQADILEIINKATVDIDNLEKEIENKSTELLNKTNEKAAKNSLELEAYNLKNNQLTKEHLELKFKCNTLETEIRKLKSIKDTCPTCGQKLPNVEKPSTELQEQELKTLQEQLDEILKNIASCNEKHRQYVIEINNEFDNDINKIKQEVNNLKSEITKLRSTISTQNSLLNAEKTKQNKLIYDRQNYDNYWANLKANIKKYEETVASTTNVINIINISKADLQDHLSVIRKMDTLIKRDFRGYLLTNIISYIDTKAKNYCEIVFGTRELNVYLDGNALDITYCGKMFDSLSGGEKQRVDLILQFAIRDMLTVYLNASSNILVLDEITDFLDKQSCKSVMTLIEKELNTTESVFIISHHADELEIPVDSEIKIEKNEDGISEVVN